MIRRPMQPLRTLLPVIVCWIRPTLRSESYAAERHNLQNNPHRTALADEVESSRTSDDSSVEAMALRSLRYDPKGQSHDETKAGIFIYDGSPEKFHKWEFRAESRFLTEKEEEKKKAVGMIVDALRGEAYQVARDIGHIQLLEDPQAGLKKLKEEMRKHVFPKMRTEAQDLHHAGHDKRGILSRQSGGTMVNYVNRRQR